jgi:1-acyl-sn-glycerol-3-phosphate acyltransferase
VGGRLYHAYRVLATGAAFGAFAGIGLGLRLVVLPLLGLLPGDARARRRRVQRIARRTFAGYLACASALGLIRVEVRGAERLREPGAHLIVANHPTLLDFVLLAALVPDLACVVKREVWDDTFFRGLVRAAGYLPNDLGVPLVDACAARLLEGDSLVLFPEGTRSPKGGLGPFRRGAAHVALKSGLPLLPVIVTCDPPTLMRGQRWYEVASRRIHFRIVVADPIDVRTLRHDAPSRAIAARRITAALRDFYEKTLHTVSA